MGSFVPNCLQPAGDTGLLLVVNRLCADLNAHPDPAITDHPLTPEARARFGDGTPIPRCVTGGPPDWKIKVGPPCIFGDGLNSFITEAEELESYADCGAALTFVSELRSLYIALQDAVVRLLGDLTVAGSRADARAELAAVRDQFASVQPSERARAFFVERPGRTPMLMATSTLDEVDQLIETIDGGDNAEINRLAKALRDDAGTNAELLVGSCE